MNVRYVAQDLDWNQSLRAKVMKDVAQPIVKCLNTRDFELSMHLKPNEENKFEMWAVLQTFDGHANEIVRRTGEELHELIHDVSDSICAGARKNRPRRRSWWFANPFTSDASTCVT